MKEKRKMMEAMVRRLDGGLVTLKKAGEDTQTLSEELLIKNEEVSK